MARQEIRSYDYVNHPYSAVRDALVADPTRIFTTATHGAAGRAEQLAAELRVSAGGVNLAADVVVSIGAVDHDATGPLGGPATRLAVSWEAARHPGLFPLMNGVLTVYPLTATETQLDFLGRYDPPLGVVGSAVDALVGHRIAEASVHRFIGDVARHLRDTLA
jgi:hypothetical protein